MREEKVKQLRKIFEPGQILAIDCFLKYLNRLKDFAEAKNFEMEQGESFVVDIKEHPIAALTLIRTFKDSYVVEFEYMDQYITLSEEFIDESSSNNTKLVAIKKAEELIKSLDNQKDMEAGEAEINAMCKALANFCIDSKFPKWAKWIAIDANGTVWVCPRKPKIAPSSESWTGDGDIYAHPKHIYTLSSMEGIDWKKARVNIDKVLQRIKHKIQGPVELCLKNAMSILKN